MNMDDCLGQPGGTVRIECGECTVVAPRRDVLQALKWLGECSPPERETAMLSVERALRRAPTDVESAVRFGMAAAIWFANEVFEGRAEVLG